MDFQKLYYYNCIQVTTITHQANMVLFSFIKIGFNKILLLGYTYHININIFQNYTINENLINNYDL